RPTGTSGGEVSDESRLGRPCVRVWAEELQELARGFWEESSASSGGSFLDYYVPTALETPKWETDKTTTPSPHHPFGAKGVGESATVGAPPAIANAVVDALRHLGVTHLDIPITPEKVWQILKNKGVAE